MKIIFGSFILLSGLFSAQTSFEETVKSDSIDISKVKSPLIVTSNEDPPTIDSAIAKLYKMPIAKPANLAIYSSLKTTSKNNTQYKILNSLDSLKTKKLAGK